MSIQRLIGALFLATCLTNMAVGGSERRDGKSFRRRRYRADVHQRWRKRIRLARSDALRGERKRLSHDWPRRFCGRCNCLGKSEDRRAKITSASLTAASAELRSTIW